MSGRTRTKLQREEQLLEIAKMHHAHMSQRAIGKCLGLSQPQICKDLKEIYRRWREPDKESLTFWKERMLSKIENHEELARGLLDDSRKPKERNEVAVRSERGGMEGEGEAAHAGPDKEVVSKKQVTESQCGNPSYLKSIEWCMEQEIKLRGLAAPQKQEMEAIKPIQFIEVREVRRNDLPPGDDPSTGKTDSAPVPDAQEASGPGASGPHARQPRDQDKVPELSLPVRDLLEVVDGEMRRAGQLHLWRQRRNPRA